MNKVLGYLSFPLTDFFFLGFAYEPFSRITYGIRVVVWFAVWVIQTFFTKD